MKFSREDIEILAPVGSYESLIAAIQGKANAVYFGIGKLNMRSKSTNNFTEEDLEKIITICNENGLKAYVTINTVIYDEDIPEMQRLIIVCKEKGVHAIIASDIAILEFAKKMGVEIHISTQQNISNGSAVKFFSRYADVMVLARELNLDKVKSIYEEISNKSITGPGGQFVKIEMFAHGALCMAISGKCYLSLHEYNHSANRGECYQICRRAYTVTDKETGAQLEIDNEYIMSPKDLCTIGFLDRLIDAGVRVLKIEGRARSAEYVKTVCECYNEAVNAICQNTYNEALINFLKTKLSTVYSRGFWDGYYLGKRLGEWSNIYGSKATKKKVYIGKVMNYFSNLKIGEFLIETQSLNVGDDIIVIGPTTGVYEKTVDEIRIDLKNANSASKGARFSMPVGVQVRRSDKLYKLVTGDTES
jgi:U32 family peptidase